MDNPIARALGIRPQRSLLTLIDHEAELAFDLDYYPRAAATWETVFEADVTEMGEVVDGEEVVKVTVPVGTAGFSTHDEPLVGKLLRKFEAVFLCSGSLEDFEIDQLTERAPSA